MKNIATVTNTLNILNEFKITAKKKFGQNFLVDLNIIDKIASSDNIDENTFVIEIGPGIGGLTEKLLSRAKFVLAYEIDDDMVAILNHHFGTFHHFKVIKEDILKANVLEDIQKYKEDAEKFVVVSNLPYYITSDIIEMFLHKYSIFSHYILMMQKEVCLRLIKNTHDKDYTVINMLIDLCGYAYKLCDVPANVFIPAPNVDSAVMVIDCKKNVDIDKNIFYKLCKQAFIMRRKTLYNNLKQIINKDKLDYIFESLNINKNTRVEETESKLYLRIMKLM